MPAVFPDCLPLHALMDINYRNYTLRNGPWILHNPEAGLYVAAQNRSILVVGLRLFVIPVAYIVMRNLSCRQ